MSYEKSSRLDSTLTAIAAFLGAAIGIVIVRRATHLATSKPAIMIDTLHANTINIDSPDVPQARAPLPVSAPSGANTLGAPEYFEESARRRTPEIYLGVATVIQGLTIGVLGQSISQHGLALPLDWITWALIISSLMVALVYWLAFVMGYLYLYRLIHLTARDHLIVTFVYFAMGLCQIVAYNQVDNPPLWFGSISLMVLIASIYSAYLDRVLRRHPFLQDPLITQIESEHDKLTLGLSLTFALLAVCTWLVTKWQFAVFAMPLISLVILRDMIRDFNKRQQIASRIIAGEVGR